MASTILYKFRSGTTFEALPLPGSAARLFDVKKAIVKAKKLDSGSMEFDLGVRNSDTNEEYTNESMILPRGTRLIVQRLPAARGHGFLARMARNEHAGALPPGSNASHQHSAPGGAPSGYYTIDSRAGDDDEFVQSGFGELDEQKELDALTKVTNMQATGPAMTGGYTGGPRPPHQGGPGGPGGMKGNFPPKANFRPNADPELREQEKKLMPKKRATGIPRTFLNLSAPPQTEGNKEGEGENESSVPLLQPNTLGFKELVSRGGGQSENTAGTRRDLDYALKLTATTIPEHLQCGICQSVVKNAMLLPWDPEGRTACETCIRDALTQNGFRCPLTGMDGVSPDDLHPNIGLRKASELFIKGVMEKIDEIEQQIVEEEKAAEEGAEKSTESNILDGDGTEKGVILSKKMATSIRSKPEDDPFGGGGGDDFGGDVFAVESTVKPNEEEEAVATQGNDEDPKDSQETKEEPENKEADNNNQDKDVANEVSKNVPDQSELNVSTDAHRTENGGADTPRSENQADTPTRHKDRRDHRRRGPPVGYAMGPAGGAVGGAQARSAQENDQGGRGFQGGRGARGGSYSPSGGGRGGGGSYQGYQDRNEYRDRGGRGGRGGRGRYGGRGDYGGGNRSFDDASNDGSVSTFVLVFCLRAYYRFGKARKVHVWRYSFGQLLPLGFLWRSWRGIRLVGTVIRPNFLFAISMLTLFLWSFVCTTARARRRKPRNKTRLAGSVF